MGSACKCSKALVKHQEGNHGFLACSILRIQKRTVPRAHRNVDRLLRTGKLLAGNFPCTDLNLPCHMAKGHLTHALSIARLQRSCNLVSIGN